MLTITLLDLRTTGEDSLPYQPQLLKALPSYTLRMELDERLNSIDIEFTVTPSHLFCTSDSD